MTIPLHSRHTAKPSQFRTPPRSSSPRCSLALVTNFSHSSLRVFRGLRTLSFSGSQLSRVLPIVCTLFRKKPGVHPYVVIQSSAGILPASVPSLFRAGRMPVLPKRGAGWASPSPTKAISFISSTYENKPRISCVSHTYAKTAELSLSQTQKGDRL